MVVCTVTERLDCTTSTQVGDLHGKVIIYSDGACSRKTREGGWGAVIFYDGKCHEANGFIKHTSNHKAELTAIIEAFKIIPPNSEIEVYTDSIYVINGVKHLEAWVLLQWRNIKMKPIQNRVLWSMLYDVIQGHNVSWFHVRGHADNPFNNRADELARSAISMSREVVLV